MATTKITDLTLLTYLSSSASDVLPIVDIDADVTKKITLTSIKSGSFSGSFQGDGSGLTGLISASHAISASYAPGGGGTPGGSDTQVQFNDGSSFGGDSNFTWNKTSGSLVVSGDTILTGSTNIRLSASRDDFKININGMTTGFSPTPFSSTIMKVSASIGGGSQIYPHVIFGRGSSDLQTLDFDLSDNVNFHGPSSHTQFWISSSLVPYAYFGESTMNLGSSNNPWNYVYADTVVANTGSISLQPTASITILNWSDMHSCYENVDGVTDGGEFIMDESHVFNPLVLKGNVTASLPGLNTGSAGYESFRSKGVTYWLINGNTDGTGIKVKPSGSSAPDLWLGTFTEFMDTPANYIYSDESGGGGGVFGNYIKITSFISSSTHTNSSGDVFWTILEKRGTWEVPEEGGGG